MTTKELNRDYNRLLKKSRDYSREFDASERTKADEDKYYLRHSDLRRELSRLYHADPAFQYVNKKSVLIFLSLNQSWRVIPFHYIHPKIES